MFEVKPQAYQWDVENNGAIEIHRVLMDSNYFIETVFSDKPSKFISTRGGFYESKSNVIHVQFEFNSNYLKDSLVKAEIRIPNIGKEISKPKLPLDGKWLMAGRVNNEGEERRRDTKRSRKTLKFLIDGYFQWTAYNTETFKFYGSGGGKYNAKDGKYSESIEYFSRDNSRSGKTLSFSFNQEQNDWYHKGFSSQGKPLHEIWTLRND
ncbi:MAG: hypothetical protein CMC79_01770 [Flavobacteriaceae bacterium]|nr:hypothetical protein [Flavobacteriaceae bacterium]